MVDYARANSIGSESELMGTEYPPVYEAEDVRNRPH